ncbi:MAG: hypothetical protein GC179_02705 [Anaerolineaceae bacterium]|nr:hypothetical protein [Anaerolineaceae bacterium]
MKLPHLIREINALSEREKHSIYKMLIPDWIYDTFNIDSNLLTVDDMPVVKFRCPTGSRAVEITIKRKFNDVDPVLYLNMADTFNNQLLVLLLVVNDLDSPRFDIDIDDQGNQTQLGTTSRNLLAEEQAMNAGLAPGQIRKGLRSFNQSVPLFEKFVGNMGHDLFLIEPLAYHNAWVFERYGFNYIHGYKEMTRINVEFNPGGELHSRLSDKSVFRNEESWKSVRGRSWAIHDGILGHSFSGFQMYKRLGLHAGICTFPDAMW